MQALEQDLESFRHCIENIGTQLDDDMNRQDMRKLRADIREKATRMENDLKDRQRNKYVKPVVMFTMPGQHKHTKLWIAFLIHNAWC